MSELMDALKIFGDGMQTYAIRSGVSDAQDQLTQINSDLERGIIEKDQAQQMKQGLGNDLALTLAGHADQGTLSTVVGQFTPSAGAQLQADNLVEMQEDRQLADTDMEKLKHKHDMSLQDKKNEILTGKAADKNSNWMIAQQDKFMKSADKDIKALEGLDVFQKMIDKGETSRMGVELGKTQLLKFAGEDRITNEDILRADNKPSVREAIARRLKLELTGEELEDKQKFYSKLFKQLRADARKRLGAKVKGNAASLAELNSNVDGYKYESALRKRIPSLGEDEQQEEMIRMRAPNGKIKMVPKSQKDYWMKKGGRPL
jgi:hypothetical protein